MAAITEVLVVGPLSTAGSNAVRRAALLAREHGWALRVLQVERDPKLLPAAQHAVTELADQLRGRLGIGVDAQAASGDLLKHVAAHMRTCGLLVVGSSSDNALKQQVAGIALDRLIRLCRAPALVVKRGVNAAFAQGAAPDGGYARVLACVDLEPSAPATVAAARAMAPGAGLEAFHAVSVKAAEARTAGREPSSMPSVLGQARAALAQLLDAGGRHEATPCVGFGDPVDAVLSRQRALPADLVVIGKRQRGLLADFFLGRLTREVLMQCSADVLVLPRAAVVPQAS
ncbi:universal stress protein [Ramlibacter humi]|uniref:Universal stress protein n=1 Tax=Ramlibacter humi TaxID=2530451 RepID=A0A4Z0BI77_9BURK|nr:universal stress protein [Ramlibacter humi]TFY99035.1 universal stress protein [Ramlibacter humi]